MKKRLFCLFLAVFCLLMLSGCSMILDVNTSIKRNGSGTITYLTGVDKELYENLTELDNSIADEMEELSYNGKTIYGVVLSADFSSTEKLEHLLTDVDALNAALPGLGAEVPLFDSVSVSPKAVSGKVNDIFFTVAGSEALDYGVEIIGCLSFTFAGPVKSANGIISEDRHTVTWDMNSMDKVLYAEAGGSFPLGLAVTVSAVLILAAVILLLCKNRRRKKQVAAAPCETDEAAGDTVLPEVPPQEVPDVPDVWYNVQTGEELPCPACGALNAIENNFCSSCGAKLTKEE